MSRDLALPVLLVLLAAPVLSATGLVPIGLLPSGPHGLLVFVLVLTALFALAVVPWLSGPDAAGPRRVLALVVAVAPFVVFGLAGTPSPRDVLALPGAGWWVLLALATSVAALPRAWARRLAVAVLVLLGGNLVLGHAAREIVPGGWLAPSVRIRDARSTPTRPSDTTPPVGPFQGAPVVVATSPLASGPGPWLVPAPRGAREGPRPRVLLLGGPAAPSVVEGLAATFVPAPEAPFPSSLELDAFDAAVLLPGAWDDADPDGPRWAEEVASFVRRGGLLVTTAGPEAMPVRLGALLGRAGASREVGPESARDFGLGRVVRAGSASDAIGILGEGGWRPRLSTAFDDGPSAARAAAAALSSAGARHPADHRAAGVLLLAYALVVGILDRLARRGLFRVLVLAGPAVAASVGLLWIVPSGPGLAVTGVLLDLGGGGGRRVEAVLLEASSAGWQGEVHWRGGGIVRTLGLDLDAGGRVELGPGERGWVVREQLATGVVPGEREDPRGGAALALLRGEVAPKDVRVGRVPALDVEIEGERETPAFVVTWPAGTR